MKNTADSLWYPVVMRLFRQPRRGDWATPIAEMAACLQEFAASHTAGQHS
jgi:hypothetical protein